MKHRPHPSWSYDLDWDAPIGQPQSISLDTHQLRPLLQLITATKDSASSDLDGAVRKEVANEVEINVWNAIDSQDFSQMTKITLRAAGTNEFNKRKEAHRIILLTLEMRGARACFEVKSGKLIVWRSAEDREEGHQPVERIDVRESESTWEVAWLIIHWELRGVDNIIAKAEEEMMKYVADMKGLDADQCLERANKYLQDSNQLLWEGIPAWKGSGSDDETAEGNGWD